MVAAPEASFQQLATGMWSSSQRKSHYSYGDGFHTKNRHGWMIQKAGDAAEGGRQEGEPEARSCWMTFGDA